MTDRNPMPCSNTQAEIDNDRADFGRSALRAYTATRQLDELTQLADELLDGRTLSHYSKRFTCTIASNSRDEIFTRVADHPGDRLSLDERGVRLYDATTTAAVLLCKAAHGNMQAQDVLNDLTVRKARELAFELMQLESQWDTLDELMATAAQGIH